MFHCGDFIEPYRLETELGAGAYGVVFAAVNTVSGQRVALKLVPMAGRAGERELHALQQCCDLHHPNLLQIYHSGIAGEYLYYTMELAGGLLEAQHLSPAELRSAAVKLADALATLHHHGLLHRDVKPGNLFWRNGEPLLGDVGLVTAQVGASLTGTPGFLTPAVYNGAAPSEQSDLYALAKSFYCLLSGNPPGDYPQYNGPFDADAAALLRAVLAVCDDDGGITSADAFRDALQQGALPAPQSRKRTVVLTAAALLAFAAFAAIWAKLETRREASPAPRELPARPVIPASPGEKPVQASAPASPLGERERMLAALTEAAQTTPDEAAAIARQSEAYKELAAEAERETQRHYPHRELTDFGYELDRNAFYQNRLQDAVQKRAAEDAAFRCYYLLRKEERQKAGELEGLSKNPENAETLQAAFQDWRKARNAYEQARAALFQESPVQKP